MIEEHSSNQQQGQDQLPILAAETRLGWGSCLLQLLEAGAVGDIFEEAGESGLAFFSE